MFLTFSKANSESSHENRPLKPQKERTAVLKHMSIFQGFRCLFVGLRGCIQYTCIQLFDRFFDGHQSKGGLKTLFFCGFAKGFDSDHIFHVPPKMIHIFFQERCVFLLSLFWLGEKLPESSTRRSCSNLCFKSWPYYKCVISGVNKKITLLKRGL